MASEGLVASIASMCGVAEWVDSMKQKQVKADSFIPAGRKPAACVSDLGQSRRPGDMPEIVPA